MSCLGDRNKPYRKNVFSCTAVMSHVVDKRVKASEPRRVPPSHLIASTRERIWYRSRICTRTSLTPFQSGARGKRRRSSSPLPGSSPAPRTRRGSQSSLPPSSPPAPFSDAEDVISDLDAAQTPGEEDGDEGEDLFGENLSECVYIHHLISGRF